MTLHYQRILNFVGFESLTIHNSKLNHGIKANKEKLSVSKMKSATVYMKSFSRKLNLSKKRKHGCQKM